MIFRNRIFDSSWDFLLQYVLPEFGWLWMNTGNFLVIWKDSSDIQWKVMKREIFNQQNSEFNCWRRGFKQQNIGLFRQRQYQSKVKLVNPLEQPSALSFFSQLTMYSFLIQFHITKIRVEPFSARTGKPWWTPTTLFYWGPFRSIPIGPTPKKISPSKTRSLFVWHLVWLKIGEPPIPPINYHHCPCYSPGYWEVYPIFGHPNIISSWFYIKLYTIKSHILAI